MNTETRMIRPYQGVEHFQSVLDWVSLDAGSRNLEGGSRSSFTLDEYLNHPMCLRFADDEEHQSEIDRHVAQGLEDLSLARSDVELIVLSSSPRLKMVDVIYEGRLDEISSIPASIEFPRPRPRSMQGPVGGSDIRVYFCLARSLEPRPLHPWRKGTWLGKQEFYLRTDISGVGFMPVKLTDEDRTELGLDPDVTKYARVDPEISVFDTDVPADAVSVYVDEGLLDRLAVAAETKVGKYVQRQIFLDVAWAIAARAQSEIHETPALAGAAIDDFSGSLVHGLVIMAAGVGMTAETQAVRESHFRDLARDPAKFLANLEGRLAGLSAVTKLFEE